MTSISSPSSFLARCGGFAPHADGSVPLLARIDGATSLRIFKDFEVVQREVLSALLQPELLHRRPSRFKAVIYSCTSLSCEGFGDRVRAIISAFMLALMTRRAFFIDHIAPVDLGLFFEPLAMNLSLHLPVDWHSNRTKFKHIRRRYHRFFRGTGNIRHETFMHETNFEQDLADVDALIVSSNDYFVNALAANMHHRSQFEHIGLHTVSRPMLPYCFINYLLSPTPLVMAEVTRLNIFPLTGPVEVFIAIHIRIGSSPVSVVHWNDPPRVPSERVDDFFACAQGIERTLLHSNPHLQRVRWFLASDAPDVLQRAVSLFGPDKLITVQLGQIMHIGRSFEARYADRSKPSPSFYDAFEAMLRVSIEHVLLASASEMVLSQSGYSLWAYVRRHGQHSSASLARTLPFSGRVKADVTLERCAALPLDSRVSP